MAGNKTNRTGNLVEGPVRKYACGVGLLDNHVVLVAENELHAALIHRQDAGVLLPLRTSGAICRSANFE